MEKGRKNIFLTGFMSSGKSSVGKVLAQKLSKSYIDLDEAIQNKFGLSVKEIFDKYGIEHFREVEAEILKLIADKKDHIISLGGGTLLKNENIKLIKEKGTLVYLRAELKTLVKRLANDQNRPLAKGNLEKYFDDRKLGYANADFEVDTEDLSIPQVTEKVLESLERCQKL